MEWRDFKKIGLIINNIKLFFAEIKSHREERKQHRLDKLVQRLPADNSGYEDLTPESNIKGGEEYIKALHWGIKNKSVKNIALAGPYGSGKSSIIQSYLKKYPSTKALKISLAAFDFKVDDEEKLENEIELGILKQLFYKVDSSKIPQSRYRKIKKKYYWKYFLATVATIIATFIVVFFFVPSIMKKAVGVIIDSGKYYGIDTMLCFIIAGILGISWILLLSYGIMFCSSKFRVKEVKLADKATLADDKDENSIFDKAMDEIIYFFEATNYNIVFIEDLDRFNSTRIFVKLRELNTIINNYDLIKRRIIFVYEFMKNIDSVEVDIDTIADLVTSDLFDGKEKLQLLGLFEAEDMTPKMAFVIRNLEIKIDKRYIESAWELLEEENRYQLLLNQLDIYTVEEISEKFSLLAPVYKALSDITKKHKEYLEISDYNKELLDKLKMKKYITSFEEESYTQEDSFTHEMQKHKHFGVWVKKAQ